MMQMDRVNYVEKVQVRARFKAPEGRYALQSEKANGLIPFNHTRSTRLTLASLQGGPEEGVWLIYNVGDSLHISRYDAFHKDPARSLLMSTLPSRVGFPTCHDYLSSKDGVDLVVGLADGEVHLLSLRAQLQGPQSPKPILVCTLTPEGSGDNQKCVAVSWIPKSENGTFIAAFSSGNLYIYRKTNITGETLSKFTLTISSSKTSNPSQTFIVPGNGINDLALSPDDTKAVVACKDGVVRMIDLNNGNILANFQTYYGSALCCSFSTDGRYIAAGGEDDLVAIYGVHEKAFVAHCEGHTSWVSRVKFDPWIRDMSNSIPELASSSRIYRLGSIGHDAQMCLWDIQVTPEAEATSSSPGTPSHKRQGSGLYNLGLGSKSSESNGKEGHKGGVRNCVPVTPTVTAPGHADMIILQPTMQHRLHVEPLSDLLFLEDVILSADYSGCIKSWKRPEAANR